MELNSQQELLDFLLELAQTVRSRGADVHADSFLRACKHYFTSSEFLGESHVALSAAQKAEDAKLTPAEQQEIADVMKQIKIAMDKRSTGHKNLS